MPRHACVLFVLLTVFAVDASAQPRGPRRRDPATAHLVEGRVVDANGQPVDGVVVERTAASDGQRPYSEGAYREVTSADGAFRFQFSGLGWGTGSTWYLAARRDGCPSTVATVQLQRGDVDGREGDVARNVVIRMPACRRAGRAPVRREEHVISTPEDQRPPRPQPRQTPTRGDVLSAVREVEPAVLACAGEAAAVVSVHFVFSGSDGRATSARVNGEVPADMRRCIVSAARAAHVEPFRRPRFEVNFPYRLPGR